MAGHKGRAPRQGVEEAGLACIGQADQSDAFHTERVLPSARDDACLVTIEHVESGQSAPKRRKGHF